MPLSTVAGDLYVAGSLVAQTFSAPTSSIGDGAIIGYRASIGDGATIGYRATIGDEASIGDRASIGKTIFITGSGNTVNYYGLDVIHIGCIRKTIAEWQQQYREVGRENDYSDEQIREYGAYIQMIAELHKTWNIEVPAYEA
jgi:carbonic anhydrase/acetyltransferase-like protein (isoleucine patch superfamily)